MSNSGRVCVSNDCDGSGAEKVFLTNKKEIQNKRRRELYAKRKEFKGNKERRVCRPSRASQLQDSHFGDNVGSETLASSSIVVGPQSCTDSTAEDVIDIRNINSAEELIERENADGPGGTGKTFLYKALLRAIRARNLIALATASSGVAASLLPGGRTAHSRFKIPLELNTSISCSVSKQSALENFLRMTKLIIWDEAPMTHRYAIEALDRMFKDINECDTPLSGKVIVLGGDFRQILPVVPNGNKTDIMQASLVFSYLWPSFIRLHLIQNMRAQLDPMYCKYLLSIGNGLEDAHSCGMIELPSNLTLAFDDELLSLKSLINVVFPNLQTYSAALDTMINRVILTPKNESVDEINNMLLKQIPGTNFTYYSFDETVDKTEQRIQEDFLNTLTPNGIPPHELILKENCPVILFRNINPSEGLCNGTRLICRKFEKNVIDAEIAVGEYRGKHVFLPRIPFIPLESERGSVSFKRTQFPMRPCFVMTINKAQGQTLDFVGLYLPKPVFSHGQLYVALSRAKTSDSIKILVKPTNIHSLLHNKCTKNVVYSEILQLVNLS